ncbi:MAG: GAF domain-containing protein [Paraglaciecola sp.]|jgi:GAF domain-containing protein
MQVNISLDSGWMAEHILFEGNTYSIGRSVHADVLINHPQISRTHATLRVNDDNIWSLQDTSSAGCYYQGKRITCLPITAQQSLRLGPVSCQFKQLNHHQLTAQDNRKMWRQRQIQQMSIQFSQCASSIALLESARHCLLQTLGCERAALILVDQDKQLQQCLGYQDWMAEHSFSGSKTIIQRCINEQRALAIGNIQNDPTLATQHSVVRNNIQAALCVPIRSDNCITGVLYADNTQGRQFFTETDIEFVESFANILSLRLLFQSIEHNISLACNH